MVERAVQLCEADEAAVQLLTASCSTSLPRMANPMSSTSSRELGPSDLSRPGGLYDPFVRGERVAHIADVRETETFETDPSRANGSR